MGWTCLTYVDLSSQMNAESQVGNDWQPIMAFMHKVVFSFSSTSCLKQKAAAPVNWIVGSHNFLDTLSIQAEENRRRGEVFIAELADFFEENVLLRSYLDIWPFFLIAKKVSSAALYVSIINKTTLTLLVSCFAGQLQPPCTHFFAAIML